MASDPPILTEQQELQRRANQVTDEVRSQFIPFQGYYKSFKQAVPKVLL